MKRIHLLQTTAVLWLTAWVTAASAATWTGSNGTDWFDAGNWDPAGVPGADAEVSISVGADILLTNETAALASFIMDGGTLTFSNWTTRLQADTVTVNGGSLTLPPAFTEAQMSNRVWIVCQDFTLADGAEIDVDYRGYATANGEGTGGFNSGAGHGGFGSCGDPGTAQWWGNRGFPYGNEAFPLAPGSGGQGSANGGHGGGAVYIQASATVTVNGTITANGQRGRPGTSIHNGLGAGGSGGSILIECLSFQGNGNGLLSVSGGSSSCSCHGDGGNAGGGRIAILYDPTSQEAVSVPTPPVKVAASPGAFGRGVSFLAECGTVYLPDSQFLSSNMSADHWQYVMLVIPDFTDWHLDELYIGGAFGIQDMESIQIDGDLALTANARLILAPVSGNSLFPGSGAVLNVGGAVTIEPSATLELIADLETGIAAYLQCGSLDLRAGGTINADYRGFEHEQGPGAGGARGGGGYGGQGSPGRETISGAFGGPVYGVQHAPLFAGSGGARTGYAGRGGGLVRVGARGNMMVDGTITAKGMSCPSVHAAGGSGGGIFLTAGNFSGAGQLHVDAGNGEGTGGSGGGGRIAVWTPYLPYEFVQEMAEAEHPPTAATIVAPEEWPGWTGAYSLAKGSGGENDDQAEDGTIFFGRLLFGTLFMIR